jgi:hypothetical protein
MAKLPRAEPDMESQLARCDREIAEILNLPAVKDGTAPAWLVTLGIEDWEDEKRAILRENGE